MATEMLEMNHTRLSTSRIAMRMRKRDCKGPRELKECRLGLLKGGHEAKKLSWSVQRDVCCCWGEEGGNNGRETFEGQRGLSSSERGTIRNTIDRQTVAQAEATA